MKEEQDIVHNFVLPEPNIQTFNGFDADLVDSLVLPSDGYVNKYDHDAQFIATGCSLGQKCLFSIKQNKIQKQIEDPHEIPVTCLRWRPSSNQKYKVIGVGDAQGHFQYWHVPSMKKIFTIEEKQNSILCCDFTKSGEHFATAGKDCDIRIYDEQTKSITTNLGKAAWNNTGHANRIFSIKFVDENTLISGGWDSVIHIWDIRQAKSVESFYGPHVSGDSIDLRDNKILVGCYAGKNQIQIWDMRNKKQLEAINWSCGKDEVANVFTCCWSPLDSSSIIAGACGVNQVRIFNEQNNKHTTAVRIFDLKHGCFSVDADPKKKQIAFSTAKQGFYVCKYDKK